eukprot:TRINITY_DN9277_c0_g1_i1.p1 TRINITY_DN9277_c0_g1~~TRINITY_DN9277_c0_g1_i1.p1  ORF type:complete len:607 (-),score=108.70 TRINITY_DN9277_c0_g1_i1:33-1853(-)
MRSACLLLEHIPHIRYKHSTSGVLCIIFGNGEIFFYPLNDQTKGNSSAKLLTSEMGRKIGKTEPIKATSMEKPISSSTPIPASSTQSSSSSSNSANSANSSYSALDVSLKFEGDPYRVFNLNFMTNPDNGAHIPPSRIELSASKSLLLVHGAQHHGLSATLVYQIVEECAPHYFQLIFYDWSFSFIDTTFSCDSTALMVIPSRFPAFLFMIRLSLIKSTASDITRDLQLRKSDNITPVQFGAHTFGPLFIMGPAKGCFGQPLKMTHISSNPMAKPSKDNVCHFVTWNDDGLGEFCLWKMHRNANAGVEVSWAARLINPKLIPSFDKKILADEDYPKNHILKMSFSPQANSVLCIVKRDKYLRRSDNGVGMMMIDVNECDDKGEKPKEKDVYWYQVSESVDPSVILCSKWTPSMLIGGNKIHAGAVIVQGKGMFELVDEHYGSAFQGLYDEFVKEACQFVQIDPYHRFWMTHGGNLRVISIIPQIPCAHPPWAELFVNNDRNNKNVWSMRQLGRRIGYFINDIEKDSSTMETLAARKNLKNVKGGELGNARGKVGVDILCGLHLYHCTSCHKLLLRPLQCSRCKATVYCSRSCQRNDWPDHKLKCTI